MDNTNESVNNGASSISTKEKWQMFKNFMHNDLGISKEDIREWIDEAIKEQARLIVEQTFKKTDIQEVIERAIYNSSWNGRREVFVEDVRNRAAKLLADRLTISTKDK